MLKELLDYLDSKNRILILGFGREGRSTYNLIRKFFPEKKLFIADQKMDLLENNIDLGEDINLEVSLGEGYLNGLYDYDLIIKAPGVTFKGTDIDVNIIRDRLTSELDLFFKFFNDKVTTIGITGTKGKSTTSSLCYAILNSNNKKASLLGNIGKPIFEEVENITEETYVVIELSSHALQYVNYSPNIAILLNMFEEHLDYYDSYEDYIDAKCNIFKYQTEKDYLIYNIDNPDVVRKVVDLKSTGITISLDEKNSDSLVYIKDDTIYVKDTPAMRLDEEINLIGLHNKNDIMFVLAVSDILGLDLNSSLKGIRDFRPLEHRIEHFANINGVDYYNDSIATIPASTINCVNSLHNIGTLIVGGKDRGIDYSEFCEFLLNTNIENIICIHATGKIIYERIKSSNKNTYYTEDFDEACRIAKEMTKPGTACVLAPAASSYGYFKNFEERGRKFKENIKNN